MSLAAHRRSRPTSFSKQALAAFVLSLAGGCVPVTDNRSGAGGSGGAASGGSSGSGGQAGGSGGSGGSGGMTGTGGGSGGSGSGGSGSGGAGSGGSGSGGAGPGGSGGIRADGGGETGGSETAPAATFNDVANNVISNCVFCHPGEVEVVRNSDFADSAGLYDLLLSTTPTKYVPAGCAFKRLVVPGKPMESLLYLKLVGMPPANCGARMPLPAEAGKPFVPIRQLDLDLVRDWIMAGAPR